MRPHRVRYRTVRLGLLCRGCGVGFLEILVGNLVSLRSPAQLGELDSHKAGFGNRRQHTHSGLAPFQFAADPLAIGRAPSIAIWCRGGLPRLREATHGQLGTLAKIRRAANTVVRPLLRSRLHGILSRRLMLQTGGRTGRLSADGDGAACTFGDRVPSRPGTVGSRARTVICERACRHVRCRIRNTGCACVFPGKMVPERRMAIGETTTMPVERR